MELSDLILITEQDEEYVESWDKDDKIDNYLASQGLI